MVWYDVVRYGMLWCDMAWYGMVWYSKIWYDMGMVRYDTVCYGIFAGWYDSTLGEQYLIQLNKHTCKTAHNAARPFI